MWGCGDLEIKEVTTRPAAAKVVTDARELAVFKRVYAFSLELHQAGLAFPKLEQYALADQLRCSSKSICANIVEGFTKHSQSKADFKRYMTIAVGLASEVGLWINYAFDLPYIDSKMKQRWRGTDAIIGMLINLKDKVMMPTSPHLPIPTSR